MGLFPEKVIPEWALPSEVTKRQHLADSLGVSPRAGTVVAVIRYLFNKHPDLAAAPPSGVSTFTMGGEGGSPAFFARIGFPRSNTIHYSLLWSFQSLGE